MLELPMFPLGTVLFPTVVLPLHVFEARYRRMVRHCLDGEPEFGVVLIERGSDAGGGDVRTDVGTVARILEAAELPDGRWVLATVGTRRIRVRSWLPDDPWPRADVEDFDDPPAGDGGPGPGLARYEAVTAMVRRALGLRAELGDKAVSATVELDEQPGLGSFQIAAIAPIGPADQQRVLATAGADARLILLGTLLDDEIATCEARLALG